MVKRLMMVFAGALMCSSTVLAQTKVTGTVVSQEDGEPIVGAAVRIDGTNTGTVTDVDGRFSLEVKSGQKLQVTYLGMAPQSVTAGPNLRIVLSPDDKTLNEVVVTALGIKRSAKSLGFAATQVKAEDITEGRSSDIMSSLAGKVAGVQVSSASGGPGSSKGVVIRGFTSLSGNNQPLYVIDGVPMNNSAVFSTDGLNNAYDFGNGANAVNPDDVESMTILKGAAATALYGSRAANGVVVITTKKGQVQKKGIGVEYNGGLAWTQVMRLPQMQNEFGMGWYGDKTDNENGSWGPKFDGSTLKYGTVYDNSQKIKSYLPIENNLKDFFDTGFRYNNSISFNGATDVSDYFVSLSHDHDDGIIPTSADSYNKYTFSARGSHKVDNLTFSSSVNYAYQKTRGVNGGQGVENMYNALMQTPRDISLTEMADLTDIFNTPGYYFTPYNVMNPYYILQNHQNQMESERVYGKFQIDYDFLKYFKATVRVGLDSQTQHIKNGVPNYHVLFPNTPNNLDDTSELWSMTGSVSQRTIRRRELTTDITLMFDKDIAQDLHLNTLVGFEGNERRYSYLYGKITNLSVPTFFDLGNTAGIPELDQYSEKRRMLSALATAELGWRDMLFLNVNFRNDWSSTLPKENRSFAYPGVTLSWIFSEMLNKEIKKAITYGKVRAAWGKTGNDADVYMTNSVYAQASSSSSGWGESKFPFTKTGTNAYSAGNVLGSLSLSPEMTTETEFGLEMAFLNNRLGFDFTYYTRNSNNQIMSLEMDPATGYSAQNTNLGKIRNRGIEFLFRATPLKAKDFQWDFSWNFTRNRSKVLSLPEEQGGESSIFGVTGGIGLYAIEGEELGIFKAYTPKKTEDGRIIVDPTSGLPQNGEYARVGSMNNKYQMGFSNTLTYKGVSLSFDIDVRHGGLMYSRTKSVEYFTGNAMQTAYNDRNPWIIPNSVLATTDANGNTAYVENTIPLVSKTIYSYWNNGGSDMDAGFLVSKSYVKLRQVVLSWDLPRKWLSRTFLTGVRLSVYGNNLLMWTPASNTFIDPEASSFGNDLEGNYGEYSSNPTSRRFGFNVNVKF